MPLEQSMDSDILFPFEHIRPIQKDMIEKVKECLRDRKVLIAHAPTGLGKTIAAVLTLIALGASAGCATISSNRLSILGL